MFNCRNTISRTRCLWKAAGLYAGLLGQADDNSSGSSACACLPVAAVEQLHLDLVHIRPPTNTASSHKQPNNNPRKPAKMVERSRASSFRAVLTSEQAAQNSAGIQTLLDVRTPQAIPTSSSYLSDRARLLERNQRTSREKAQLYNLSQGPTREEM